MLYREGHDEVSLRRAISACYYAVFHAIAVAGANAFTGPDSLRNQIARSYDHATIAAAAREVEKRHRSSMPPSPEANLVLLAKAVLRLQQKRNEADYDLITTITWDEADELSDEAGRALNALTLLEGQAILAEFLLSPLLLRRKARG